MEMDNSLQGSDDVDSLNSTVIHVDTEGELRRSRAGTEIVEERDEDEVDSLLRLPEMTDTSMDNVGQPLRDVMDRLNGVLDKEEGWDHPVEEGNSKGCDQAPEPPAQQPFREDSGGKPPDPAPGGRSCTPLASSPDLLQASPASTELCCFTPNSPDSAPTSGGHHDSTEHSKSQTLSGGHDDEGKAKATAGQEPNMKKGGEDIQEGKEIDNALTAEEAEEQLQEEKLSPSESSHPAEFK